LVKDNLMYEVLFEKFSQHEALRNQLLETGTAHIVEHTASDHYWGDGGDGSGKNQLGITIMKVRDALKNQYTAGDGESKHEDVTRR